MFKEFKAFISRGNVIDMAVGVIVGAAFTNIVTSLVKNLLNPFIGIFLGKVDLSTLVFHVGDTTFRYGAFLNSLLNFFIIAFVVFLLVKLLTKLRLEPAKKTPAPSTTDKYLQEIVELLRQRH
ncbi:Large-conductance mechanosensitive channel [Fructilactobacillus florum 8D]|uniref:Large-conductance mechanosensitive channel n=2 Tax=Fructilactobacillus florum TaxID=640331 RepID=W9EL86_9LACO|nr:large-conductance mechanosensitive channel protein MscL [Fructilactobacillus florum]ETO40429.1 Large-conductance mechanosensitive channel [Fructilactobacillus florum 8D]KRM90055.1 MscL family large conductance mechanosensitive ion channel [Fructilactobacillus florum DSM 22689 = JCM 16035]